MYKFTELKAKLTAIEEDADKFFNKGNKAAGVRLRKGMQDIKDLANEVRTAVIDENNKS